MSFLSQLLGLFTGGGGGFLDPMEAKRMVAEGAQLVDVRTDAEWSSGHVPGATHIPVAEIGRRHTELDKTKPVIVYCRSGARSGRAASILQQAGFSEVFNLGPMSAWPVG